MTVGPSPTAELERLEYISLVEEKRGELDAKIREIRAGVSHSVLHSGLLNRRICETWEAYCRDLILTKARLRRQFGKLDAVLVTSEALDQLQNEMTTTIYSCNRAIKDGFEREGTAAGAATPVPENLINVGALTAMVQREVQKLKYEKEAGIMHEATDLHGAITVNVNNSAIAALNLGCALATGLRDTGHRSSMACGIKATAS